MMLTESYTMEKITFHHGRMTVILGDMLDLNTPVQETI